MRFILTPIMRPIARRKLAVLYAESANIAAAIERARKSKARVKYLYDLQAKNHLQRLQWEQWVTRRDAAILGTL